VSCAPTTSLSIDVVRRTQLRHRQTTPTHKLLRKRTSSLAGAGAHRIASHRASQSSSNGRLSAVRPFIASYIFMQNRQKASGAVFVCQIAIVHVRTYSEAFSPLERNTSTSPSQPFPRACLPRSLAKLPGQDAHDRPVVLRFLRHRTTVLCVSKRGCARRRQAEHIQAYCTRSVHPMRYALRMSNCICRLLSGHQMSTTTTR
jgi:hypothetical protein